MRLPAEHDLDDLAVRVVVLAAPCDARWRTERGLELVGPRYFGYDVDYVPVEARAAAAAPA